MGKEEEEEEEAETSESDVLLYLSVTLCVVDE